MPDAQLFRSEKRARTIEALERLPLNPGPLAMVMQAGTDPDALIKALEQCPVLAARIIAVANSAGSSAIHRMDCISRCVHHLGGKQARTVALALAMHLITQELKVDEQAVAAIWSSATTKAVAAAMSAQVLLPDQVEQAYCVGLVQDIALPVLLAMDSSFVMNTLAHSDGRKSWTELEQEHFGIDHAELGALLLQRWGAGEQLVAQVRRHHAKLTDDDMAFLAELPVRFAGLLPHLQEQPTRAQAQTLAAVHVRFLAEQYKTLDALMNEANKRVKAMGKVAGGPVVVNAELIHRIVSIVAADAFALVAQVSRLDRQLAEQIDRLADVQTDAFCDPLTGLLNRRGLDACGGQMLAQAHKARLGVACLVIDLDDFKPINDQFGHAAGDALLKAAADLLRSNVSAGDLVARLGGDEYAILVTGTTQGDAHAMAQRLHATCNGRRVIVGPGQKATLKMSIGGVYLNEVNNTITAENLLAAADQAMYRCKQRGKSSLEFAAMRPAA